MHSHSILYFIGKANRFAYGLSVDCKRAVQVWDFEQLEGLISVNREVENYGSNRLVRKNWEFIMIC